MRIRRVTEHAYGQQKQNRPGDTAGSIQRILPISVIG
jgi:hypothetical protein